MSCLLLAGLTIFALDFATTIADPAQDPLGAARSLVVGPAPAGFEPLIKPGTGLDVTSVVVLGNLTHDLNTTAIAFQQGLLDGTTLLDAGLFLDTGFTEDALPPNKSDSTTGVLSPSREDPLCDLLSGGAQTYDAQRVVVEFTAGAATQSMTMRWVFGTEEYPEYVGSAYNDVFGVFLFERTEHGPAGGLFSSTPWCEDLCNVAQFQLTQPQQDWLVQHQIAFDSSGAPITVNGPFFSAGQVVTPPDDDSEFDGSTPVLTTVAPLVAGGQYVMYIVIADTADQNYDSGAFISISGSVTQVSDPATTSSGGTPSGGGATPGSGSGSSGSGSGSSGSGSSSGGGAGGHAGGITIPLGGSTGGSSSAAGGSTSSGGGGSGGGCALSTLGAEDAAAGALLPWLALVGGLALSRRRLATRTRS